MSNIKITIEGVEKEYSKIIPYPLDYKSSRVHFDNNWYEVVEPVKQDYEIQSFRHINKSIVLKLKDGSYGWENGLGGYALSAMLYNVANGFHVIESVKRLTDGEVFTVKDGMNYKDQSHLWNGDQKYCSIEKFSLRDGFIFINEHFINTDPVRNIEDWVLYVKPTILFTTEDGVIVTDREQSLYGVSNVFTKYWARAIFTINSDVKYFSTSEARDEYILQNKPVTVTLAEVTEYFKDRNDLLQPNIEDVKYFFKSKQNNTI